MVLWMQFWKEPEYEKSVYIIAAYFINKVSVPLRADAAFPLKESNSDTASVEVEEYYNKLPQGVRNAFESYTIAII